jgi:putative peptidoglycan lipid II flippase
MVSKILKLFSKEIAGVHQAAFLLGFFTLLAQLLGLIRDRALAHFFGAGLTLDIYYASFRIPDLIFATAASLVSISVIIPFINRAEHASKCAADDANNPDNSEDTQGIRHTSSAQNTKHEKDIAHHKEVRNILDSIFTSFGFLMVLLSTIFYIAMPWISEKVFIGFNNPEAVEKIIFLSRILLLQPICLGVSNILGALTQLRKRFVLYALSPIVYNLAIVFGVFILQPYMGIDGVVWGVVLGGLLHVAIQIPYIKKERLLPRLLPLWKVDWRIVRDVFFVSIPRTLTLSASMIELVFLTARAATLTVGSISVLSFSFNIQSVPLGIVGVSYALAAFPTLSAHFAKGEREKFLSQIISAIRHVIFWSIPIAAYFIVLRAQIVRTVLGSGNFNWDNTRLTAACLAIFVVSLVAQALELLFLRAYYAAGQTRKPLIINLISSLITLVSPVILIMLYRTYPLFGEFFARLFRVEGIQGIEILMLPLGYTIGTIVNTVAFWSKFEKDFSHGRLFKETWRVWIASLGAGVIGGFFAYLGLNIFDGLFDLETLRGVFLHGFSAGMMGIVVSIMILKSLRSVELEEVLLTIHKKIPLVAILGSVADRFVPGKRATTTSASDLATAGKVLVYEPDKIEP